MILMKTPPATRGRFVALAVTTALLLAGCGGGLGSGDSGTGPRVVASFYPLAYIAQRVAGEHAEVVNLTSPGVEPHDLELDIEQTGEVAESDLVVYAKGLQPAVDATVAEHGPDHAVDAAAVVDLEPLTEGDHADEEHAATGDGHDHGEEDLHFWMDPLRLADVAGEIKRRLVEVDPDHAEAYESNLRDLERDLDALDRAYARGLEDCAVDTVVVSHEAFGYLEKYGLHFEAIAGLSPDAEPSAAHLAELGDLIRKEGVTTVFSERLASPAMAQTLARDLGVSTDVLDPIEGLSDATADEDYLSLMRTNLAALEKSQECR
jgi:zinc transport system substrate-binding protein